LVLGSHYFISPALYDDININSINNLYVDNQVGLSRFAQGPTPDNFSESHQYISTNLAALHFVDAENGNYNLTEESPVVDAGTSMLLLPSLTSDLVGKPRGALYDIGAFEFSD